MATTIPCINNCGRNYSSIYYENRTTKSNSNISKLTTMISLDCKKNTNGCGKHKRYTVSNVNDDALLISLHDAFINSKSQTWDYCRSLTCDNKVECLKETTRNIAETQANIDGCSEYSF